MRKVFFVLLALYTIIITVAFVTLFTKERHKTEVIEQKANLEAQCDSAIVNAVRMHSMLYTAEARSSKTLTYTSNNKLSFNFLGVSKDVNLPLSKTEATIPVTVTYKAGINLQQVDKGNIHVSQYPDDGRGGVVVIVLPDPVIVETAVQVDHENEKQTKQLLGKGLTYEKYQELVRQAKKEAWDDLSEEDIRGIVETAKVSATELIIPQLRALGFDSITINYRQEMTLGEIKKLKN